MDLFDGRMLKNDELEVMYKLLFCQNEESSQFFQRGLDGDIELKASYGGDDTTGYYVFLCDLEYDILSGCRKRMMIPVKLPKLYIDSLPDLTYISLNDLRLASHSNTYMQFEEKEEGEKTLGHI